MKKQCIRALSHAISKAFVAFLLSISLFTTNGSAQTITITEIPTAPFTSCQGVVSAEQYFVIKGDNLQTNNLVITAPPLDFEVSKTPGTGFASSITFVQIGGNAGIPGTGFVTPSKVYIRRKGYIFVQTIFSIICEAGSTTQYANINAVITPNNTIALTSAGGTNAQIRCINTALTNITYATTGATGATFSGLPTGVTGSWANNGITISGTPTAAGTFNYTVTLTGGCPATITATGTITVTPNNTVALTSAAGTNAQTVCINSALTNITYATTAATGATFSGLPAGVTGTWANNVATISGTPTVSTGSPFSYTVTLTGGCSPIITATGTITVKPNSSVVLTSAAGTDAQNLCINTTLTTITYATTGATGATFIGLPAGVTGSWANNVATISGTPTAPGTFNYTMTLVGGCNTAIGTITVNAVAVASASPTTQTICRSGTITPIAITGTGTSYTWTRDNATTVTGIAASGSGNISGVLTNTTDSPQTVTFTITPIGICNGTPVTATVVVNPVASINLSSAVGTNAQTVCFQSPITNITYATTGATGATFIGLPTGVTGNWANNVVTISGTPTTTTGSPFSYTVTLTGGCGNVTATGTIKVNPLPNAVATPANQTVCGGLGITTINLTGNLPGTVYNWTRDNTPSVTGIAASGSGDISGTLTNTTNAPVTVTFTITPSFTESGVTCNVTAITATVVVNPTPNAVATPSAQAICSGSRITTLVLTGNVTGTIYNWTRDNTSTVTGIAASSSGDISGILFNSTTSPVTVTFTITPSYTNAGITCTGTPITATVTVNPNPASATITDAGISFCAGSSTTLSAPADPNYTYAWERSLTGIAAPNSFTAFGGTAQTQVVTTSGVYRAIVTNQFNCFTRDTTAVKFGDFVFSGSLGAGDAQQTGRMNRFGVVSTCDAPKSYPGTFATTGARFYDTYTITNPRGVPVCATIGVSSGCGQSIFSAAYLNSYNPNSLATNYLADHGSSFSESAFYEATIPANGTIVVVVHELNAGAGCGYYDFKIDVPRDASGITVTPNTSVCAGTSVTLTAPVANTYSWTGGVTSALPTINQTPSATTTYNLTLGYGNQTCTATASKEITVNPIPTLTTIASPAICAGATSFTIPYSASSGNPTTYSISGTGITTVTDGALPTTPITVNLSSGASGSSIPYTLTVKNVGTCVSNPAITGSVAVNATPAVPTSPMATSPTVTSGNRTTLTASGCSGTLVWYDVDNPTTALPNNMPTVTSSQTFFARCAGANSCVSLPSSNVTVSPVVLPVELLLFEGKNTEGGNLLTWITASEINNKGVYVERSTGNGDWEALGFVKGNGKGSTYQFTDKNPLKTSYYRLRQIDNDGKETLSEVISIQSKGYMGTVKIYPSVTTGELTVEGAQSFEIVNTMGQVMLSEAVIQGSSFNIHHLASGLYIVRGVDTEGSLFSVKIVKE